jgi:hypothetical protein
MAPVFDLLRDTQQMLVHRWFNCQTMVKVAAAFAM